MPSHINVRASSAHRLACKTPILEIQCSRLTYLRRHFSVSSSPQAEPCLRYRRERLRLPTKGRRGPRESHPLPLPRGPQNSVANTNCQRPQSGLRGLGPYPCLQPPFFKRLERTEDPAGGYCIACGTHYSLPGCACSYSVSDLASEARQNCALEGCCYQGQLHSIPRVQACVATAAAAV